MPLLQESLKHSLKHSLKDSRKPFLSGSKSVPKRAVRLAVVHLGAPPRAAVQLLLLLLVRHAHDLRDAEGRRGEGRGGEGTRCDKGEGLRFLATAEGSLPVHERRS